jgi:FtsP/CotA-like multicopper oxidase with cupredoxin domain
MLILLLLISGLAFAIARPPSYQSGGDYCSSEPVTYQPKTVYYNWNISWTYAAPDGFVRPVIGINGQWPCPQINVTVGDQVVVDIYNGLGNQSTSLHWHGMRQNGTTEMDGASGTSQCPIAPGQSFTYSFIVSYNPGQEL